MHLALHIAVIDIGLELRQYFINLRPLGIIPFDELVPCTVILLIGGRRIQVVVERRHVAILALYGIHYPAVVTTAALLHISRHCGKPFAKHGVVGEVFLVKRRIAVIVALALVFGKKQTDINKTKSVSYAAICAALSFALSYVRFVQLPQGGSVTLASLLPLMIYSYMFGIRRGVVLGAVYGLLQFIQSPWFIHPVQFLLDYPIAFAAIGLAGIFREKKLFDNKKPVQFALGALLVVILRYFSHVVSGIFVFGSGDPDNYSAVAWSFLYNSFAFADIAICIVAGCALFASKSFNAFLEKSSQ